MEEYQLFTDKGETEEIINYDPIKIAHNEIQYDLNIQISENMITFSIIDKTQIPSIKFQRNMGFKELKDLNLIFQVLNSLNDFYDYLKLLSDNKKLNIKRGNNKISLILNVEVLLKQQAIEIDLFQVKKDIDLNIKEIWEELLNIKDKKKEKNEEMIILKNENNELIKEINILKIENKEFRAKIEEQNKEINELKEFKKEMKSLIEKIYLEKFVIMKEDESNMIFIEIENKINKKIKYIKKLYQATIDGGDSEIFHKKCDNIPNTLVIIESEGHRRFGGFTPIPWKSEKEAIFIKDPDMKTFVFSLDNKKIYNLRKGKIGAVYHFINSGPCFGGGRDIAIDKNIFKERNLFTHQISFDYHGQEYALSECDYENRGKALEYEVFQVIFY